MNKCSLASLIMIPALLIGSITTPVQSQEMTKLAQLLDFRSPQARNAEVIVENFLTLLAQQKFEQAKQYLSPSIAGYSTTSQLQQLWQKVQRDNGSLVQISGVNATELLGTYTVIATATFQNSTEDLTFKLDQNQKITEANFLWLGNIKSAAEQFVNALAKGDYAVARTYLAPDLKEKFLPETIKQRWENLIAKVGPFKQLKSSSVIRNTSYDAVQLDVEFQNYSGKFFVFFNPLSQIIAIDSPLQKR
jgi:hypothetical protein